jgi:DASS family divalent anion:Na+ symporter
MAAPREAAPTLRPVKLVPLAATLLAGAAVWLIPAPPGVTAQAWGLLAVFVATIVGLMAKPLPMGAVALCAVVACAASGLLTVEEALDAFDHKTIWLIVLAFLISRGFIKTRLGERIAYLLMSLLGKKTLGLAYGLSATDLVLAPAMPSNTARAGGVVYPLVLAVSEAYGSKPDAPTRRRIGTFLMLNSFQATVITSAMFLTAMAANPLAQQFAADAGVPFTWTDWALAACVPGLLSLLVVPLVLYLLHPPEIRDTPAAAELARDKLRALGPMSAAEWVMLGVFFLLLGLWIFGPYLGMDATVAALVGLAVLLLSGALTWDDVLGERGAWDALVWFSALVMMADGLNRLGLIGWFSRGVGAQVAGVPWTVAFPVLVLIYYYSHYLFASNTAHVTAMYASFLAVALVAGAPPLLAALVLGFASNLFSSTTHYGTGPAAVFFGAGYVPVGTWWAVGAVISVVHLLIWGVVGALWWKAVGIW